MIAHHSTAPHTRGWFCNVTKVVLTLVRCLPNDSGLTPGEPGHLAREVFCKSQQMHCKYLWQINTKRQPRVSDIRYWRKIKRKWCLTSKTFSVSNRSTRHYDLWYDDGWHFWLHCDMAPGPWAMMRRPSAVWHNKQWCRHNYLSYMLSCSGCCDAPLWKYLSRFLVQLQIYISFPFSSPAAGRNHEY